SVPISITIAADAALTQRTMTVTTPAGTSQPFSGFTVTPPTTPVITASRPTSAQRATVRPTATLADRMNGATAVTFSGTGVTASIGAGGTAPSLPISITIAADAALTQRTVTLTTPAGISLPFSGFTVAPPTTPVITAISPTSGAPGAVGLTATL